jgi:hypothetical protein
VTQHNFLLTIQHRDGRSIEAILLCHADGRIRVQIPGCDDATEFRQFKDIWVSEDCEPVRVAFPRAAHRGGPVVKVDGALCAPAVGEQFLKLLFEGDPKAFEVLACSDMADPSDLDDPHSQSRGSATVSKRTDH